MLAMMKMDDGVAGVKIRSVSVKVVPTLTDLQRRTWFCGTRFTEEGISAIGSRRATCAHIVRP